MGLELIESENFPIYNDGRVFDWVYHGNHMTLGKYSVIHRFGDVWEICYNSGAQNDERLLRGLRKFCMKLVEHQIRQDEMDTTK